MSYPQQVPPGWTKGEPVFSMGGGHRYAIGREPSVIVSRSVAIAGDEILITFDSRADTEAWLKWWVS